jgi:hypothetical protein
MRCSPTLSSQKPASPSNEDDPRGEAAPHKFVTLFYGVLPAKQDVSEVADFSHGALIGALQDDTTLLIIGIE